MIIHTPITFVEVCMECMCTIHSKYAFSLKEKVSTCTVCAHHKNILVPYGCNFLKHVQCMWLMVSNFLLKGSGTVTYCGM